MSAATILVVEDEAIVAADLVSKLGQLGYGSAGIAARGAEAVALAREQHPSLVLMDIRLAGAMDGVEAAEQIRRDCDIPVIYLTAHSDQATLQRARLTEPFGYILKPFDERELEICIQMALYKHHSEHLLREQREWFRVTLDSIGDAVLTTDAEGWVTFLNPVGVALTGWTSAEAMGQPAQRVFQVIHEDTGAPFDDLVSRVLREKCTIALANHAALVTKDGRRIPVEDSAAPITDAGGNVIGVVLVFHDVTAKRQAAEQILRQMKDLREANEDLSRFNRVAVDRELRMVELKKEVNALCQRSGEAARYPLAFEKGASS